MRIISTSIQLKVPYPITRPVNKMMNVDLFVNLKIISLLKKSSQSNRRNLVELESVSGALRQSLIDAITVLSVIDVF